MKKLSICQSEFNTAFNVDENFQASPTTAYLDSETGEITWVYDDDQNAELEGLSASENKARRKLVKGDKRRYFGIQGKSHGDHHDLLKAFFDSPWTDDVNRANWARNSYWGSIGAWKKNVLDEDIVRAYESFRDARLEQLALEFLARHGIEPEWK